MTAKQEYDRVHHWAKAITCFLVVLLLILGRHFEIIYLDIAAVIIWIFGINYIAYCLELLFGYKHRHNKI